MYSVNIYIFNMYITLQMCKKKYKSAVADSELFIRIGPLTEVKEGGCSSHASVSPSESYALPF